MRQACSLPAFPAFSTDGQFVAGGSIAVGIWDAQTGELVRTLPAIDGFGANLAFSPDDRLLAVSNWANQGGLIVYDVPTGTELWSTEQGATDVAFAPDGSTLYSGFRGDTTIRLWDPETGEQVGAFEGHSGTVTDLHVSADGSLVASSGTEVLVWETDTLTVVHELRGHSGDVDAIDITADGSLVVTASGTDASTRL